MSTFPKKGSRTIVVDGVTYLWRLNFYEDDYNMPDYCEVLVQREGGGEMRKKRFAGDISITPSMVADLIKGVDTPGKFTQTLADGTVVEVEDVPINRDLIEAGAILPEAERRDPTPEELKEDEHRANAMFADLSEPPLSSEVLAAIQAVLEDNDGLCMDNDQERFMLTHRLEVALRPFTKARSDG